MGLWRDSQQLKSALGIRFLGINIVILAVLGLLGAQFNYLHFLMNKSEYTKVTGVVVGKNNDTFFNTWQLDIEYMEEVTKYATDPEAGYQPSLISQNADTELVAHTVEAVPGGFGISTGESINFYLHKDGTGVLGTPYFGWLTILLLVLLVAGIGYEIMMRIKFTKQESLSEFLP